MTCFWLVYYRCRRRSTSSPILR